MPIGCISGKSMTRQQFLATLKRLGLGKASKATLEATGIESIRTLQNYTSGRSPIPGPVVRVLELLLEKKRWHS
jgi:hypothetical protein